MDKKTGGPAFPVADLHGDYINGMTYRLETRGGMSLRDYFAAAALQGIISCYRDHGGATTVPTRSAKAYEYADAMMAAREAA